MSGPQPRMVHPLRIPVDAFVQYPPSNTPTNEQQPYCRTGAEVDGGRIAVHKRRRQRDWPHTENPCCGINESESYPINRVGYARPSNHVEKLMSAATVRTYQKPGHKGKQCRKGSADCKQ